MIKYIKQPDNSYTSHDESSETYQLLNALDDARRPVFLDESDAGVQSWLKAQAELAKVKIVATQQAHRALLRTKSKTHDTAYDEVVAFIESMPASLDKREAEVMFYRSNNFERDNPQLQGLWKAMGKSAKELQSLFDLANTL
jgi:hypothetical protein